MKDNIYLLTSNQGNGLLYIFNFVVNVYENIKYFFIFISKSLINNNKSGIH